MFANQTWKGEVPVGVAEVVRVESNIIKWMGMVMASGSKTRLMIAMTSTVTLRLSHDAKGKEEDAHFLPLPNGNFYLLLGMYGGDEDV